MAYSILRASLDCDIGNAACGAARSCDCHLSAAPRPVLGPRRSSAMASGLGDLGTRSPAAMVSDETRCSFAMRS
jgi:hypothetical protein